MAPRRNGHTELRDQSAGELVQALTEDMRTLVRQEIDLAKAEMTRKGKHAGKGAGMVGGGGVVALLALAAMTTCIIAALDTVMPLWLAALIVTVVYGAIAAALALTGKNRVQEAAPPVPEQTVETVKEDVRWLKHPRR